MRAIRAAIVAGLLAAAGIASSLAQAPQNRVFGTVVSIAREPVTGAAVALLTDKGELPTAPALRQVQQLNSPDSRFEWPAVPAGSYKLIVASAKALKDWPAPATVQRFVQRAFPLTVGPDQADVQLRLIVEVGPAPSGEINIVNASVSTTMMVGGPGGPPPGARPRPPGTGVGPPRSNSGPSTISGVVTDDSGRPVAGVHVQAARRQSPASPNTSAFLPTSLPVTTDANGAYRLSGLQPGAYVVGALAWKFDVEHLSEASVRSIPAESDAQGRRTAHYTTYYPGTTNSRTAQVITIEPGETKGIDFVLKRGPVGVLTMTVNAPDPRAPGLNLAHLLPASLPEQFGQRNAIRATVDAKGTATFADVQPGSYRLTYFAFAGWVREPVEVMPGLSSPMALTLKPYLTVSGRVVLQPTRVSAGPEMLSAIKVSVTPSPLTSGMPFQVIPVSADGTFSIPRVSAGPHVLNVAPGGPSWVTLSAMINGQDSLDRPVEISGNVTDATLTLTDVATNVHGRVIGMSTGSVVVFSSDNRFWIPGGSRRVRVVTITPGSVFSVNGLPPGTYHAAAFPAGARIVNSALEEAKARTAPFELAIGEQKEIIVR